MARPKLPRQQQWTDALKAKQDKELGKLKMTLSQQLCQDLHGLYEDSDATDISIATADGELRCHACILLARLPQLLPRFVDEGYPKVLHLQNVKMAEAQQMIRSFYKATGPVSCDWFKDAKEAWGPNRAQAKDTSVNHKTSSVAESNTYTAELEETIICCDLAEDLLALYETGVATDQVIRVSDTEFKVHRALFAHRSDFFQAMLGGDWAESRQAAIDLQGISAATFQQVVLYIYGGFNLSTPATSLLELVAAADMYGLQGFKQVVAYRIKAEKCHFFHKPCPQCIAGVLEVLPLLFSYNFSELLQKAVQWSARHMVRVWATKEFASLPQEILDQCLGAAVHEINRETVINTILETDQLLGRLTEVQWSQTVRHLGNKLMEACMACIQHKMDQILTIYSCTGLAKSMSEWSLAILEDVFKRAIETLPTETACKAYISLLNLKNWTEAEKETRNDLGQEFVDFVLTLEEECKNYMIVHVNLLYNTPQWMTLPKDVQQKIRADAYYVSLSDKKVVKSVPKVTPRETKKLSKAKVSCVQNKPPTGVKSNTTQGGRDSHHGNKQLSQSSAGASAASSHKVLNGTSQSHSTGGKDCKNGAASAGKIEKSQAGDTQTTHSTTCTSKSSSRRDMNGASQGPRGEDSCSEYSANLKASCDKDTLPNDNDTMQNYFAGIAPHVMLNGVAAIQLPTREGVEFINSFVPSVEFMYKEPVCDIYFDSCT